MDNDTLLSSPWRQRLGRAARWAGLVLAGAAALQVAAWPAAAAMAVLAALFAAGPGWNAGRARRMPVLDEPLPLPTDGSPAPTSPLPEQIVPVWRRSVAAARQHAESSATDLMERFTNIHGQLDLAVGRGAPAVSLELGATDDLLDRHRVEIDELLNSTRSAMHLRDQALDTVRTLISTIDELGRLAREVQNIGRATHLLALNASVEATRAGERGEGFGVVAQEVRQLAGQSRQTGLDIARLTSQMRERLAEVQHQAIRTDTDPDEVNLQAEQSARRVVRALIGSLSEVGQASNHLRDTSRQVQADIEKILMGLQSQDRLNQMLISVEEDMDRLSQWFKGVDDPAAVSPAQWLERLENSYTMEEMRTAHHGTVSVDRQASVEFF
jgi:methyl-accepting chemotaxis protein